MKKHLVKNPSKRATKEVAVTLEEKKIDEPAAEAVANEGMALGEPTASPKESKLPPQQAGQRTDQEGARSQTCEGTWPGAQIDRLSMSFSWLGDPNCYAPMLIASDDSPVEPQPLSEVEQNLLQQCEEVIEKGKEIFVQTAIGFYLIRKNQLYRGKYGTFQQYCQERWGFTRQRGYQLAKAGEHIASLGPDSPMPQNESQIRALQRIQAEIDKVKTEEKSAREPKAPAEATASVEELLIQPQNERAVVQNVDQPEVACSVNLIPQDSLWQVAEDLLHILMKNADFAAALNLVEQLQRSLQSIIKSSPSQT
jgi:hypothetical protein